MISIADAVELWQPPPDKTNAKVKANKHATAASNGQWLSLYEWLDTADFSQSWKIKSGNYIQHFIKEGLVQGLSGISIIDLKSVSIKNGNNKEPDLCLEIMQNPTIHYREIKTNTNLDTEKRPATMEKITAITNALRLIYPKHRVISGLFCPCWLESDGIVEGFNDFIGLVGYEPISITEHRQLGIDLGIKIRVVRDEAGQK